MNFKSIFTLVFLSIASLGFSQTQDLDKDIDRAVDELTKELESLDLNKIINEDLIAKIQEIKPSEEEINNMQDMLIKSLGAVKKIDFSALEGVFKEFEKVFEEMDLDQHSKKSPSKDKPAKTGKRI